MNNPVIFVSDTRQSLACSPSCSLMSGISPALHSLMSCAVSPGIEVCQSKVGMGKTVSASTSQGGNQLGGTVRSFYHAWSRLYRCRAKAPATPHESHRCAKAHQATGTAWPCNVGHCLRRGPTSRSVLVTIVICAFLINPGYSQLKGAPALINA